MKMKKKITFVKHFITCGQLEHFWTLLASSPLILEALDVLAELDLPDWYLGGGCITQTIWNAISGYEALEHILDFDIVYFDEQDLSYAAEDGVIQTIRELFKDFPIPVDIKNQARVHLWYPERFGIEIEPYTSTENAIDSWPTSAACIGVSLRDGVYQVYSTFGLDDIFNLVVRPNKRLIKQDVYDKKTARWKAHWPNLDIRAWDSIS